MTNEEAIVLLEDQMNFNRTMQRGWGNSMIETDYGKIVNGELYANQHKDVADALELAIAALRAGGKDMNATTMPAGQPLTLEQLRGMDGQCVKVVVDGVELLEMLALVEVPKDEDCVLLRNNLGGVSEFYSDDDLREDGVKVYAYQPRHIDREAWEPCGLCGRIGEADPCYKDGCFKKNAPACDFRCDKFLDWRADTRRLTGAMFCQKCGRPLTEAAWAELEKRVRRL